MFGREVTTTEMHFFNEGEFHTNKKSENPWKLDYQQVSQKDINQIQIG